MMGVKELRIAFNSVAEPRYSASRALLHYEAAHDSEWQILTFAGTGADGAGFEVTSGRLRPGTNVEAAARETAQRLLDKGTNLS